MLIDYCNLTDYDMVDYQHSGDHAVCLSCGCLGILLWELDGNLKYKVKTVVQCSREVCQLSTIELFT